MRWQDVAGRLMGYALVVALVCGCVGLAVLAVRWLAGLLGSL